MGLGSTLLAGGARRRKGGAKAAGSGRPTFGAQGSFFFFVSRAVSGAGPLVGWFVGW